MKQKIICSLILVCCSSMLGFSQQGFNYQAVARNDAGDLLNGQSLDIRISIHAESQGGPLVWQEIHGVTTNNFGMFDLVVGSGSRTGGSAPDFSDIVWGSTSFFMKVEVNPGTGWLDMGTAPLASVPFAMNAKSVAPLDKLDVKEAPDHHPDSALFEVKNQAGNTVFAVYNEGVRVYVADEPPAKGHKGGFAIGGFDAAKGITNDYMWVTPDSVRIYVDKTQAKGHKGGFAIGGFDAAKGPITDLMLLTPENYFIGHEAGRSISTGLYNSFIGYNAGMHSTNAFNNVFIGYETGMENTSGNWNVFIGNNAGSNNMTGYSNIMIGDGAGEFNTDGVQNVILGDWAGRFTATGNANVFIGAESGHLNESGSYNVFIGESAGRANSIGEDNVFIGTNTGTANTEGNYNTFVGSNSGISNQVGEYNTFVGYQAGESTTANWNTMMGYLAGQMNTSGGSQVMLGYQAGMNNTGSYNTMVGSLAGYGSGNGGYNTYLGLVAGGDAPGNYNVFLGAWAGRFQSGDNQLIIESSLYSGSDNKDYALVYGNFDNNHLKFNANVGVNYDAYDGYGLIVDIPVGQTEEFSLYVFGSAYAYLGTWQASDIELKTNIQTLSRTLDKIKQIRGVSFEWNQEALSKHNLQQRKSIGVIAQELEAIFPEMVKEDMDGNKAVNYSELTPVLIEAIKEQQAIIEALEARIAALENKLE